MKLMPIIFAWSLFTMTPAIAQVIPHYSFDPQSPAELVDKADAVIRGRVEQKQQNKNSFKAAATEYKIRVTDVLKTDNRVRVGTVVTLHRLGGINSDGTDVPEAGFAPFAVGEDLILFLDWAPGPQVYMPLRGPDGAYRVNPDGRAKAYGRTKAAKEMDGKLANDLSVEIRKLKK